ncbi:MAG TPA: DUF6580 family putative transport protein [Lacipirellulaceae bacterium]|nr:DUF6580 family putative transport protein [Lacipirellulaceae bacterium]
MKRDRRQNLGDLLVFALLVAIGVAGRWGQPEWEFTPTAAAAIFAGFYFSRVGIAILVPVTILAISDLILPAYDSIAVMIATYAVMIVPVWFGRLQRGEHRRWLAWSRWIMFGILPATLFYLVTNFAVWAFQSSYEKTLAGLAQCYVAAVPFFRWMLAGDVFYLAVLFTCLALAGGTNPVVWRKNSTAAGS